MRIYVKDVIFACSCATRKGVQLPYVNFEDRCTKCGTCEVACPDQAITVDLPENWWMNEENDINFNPNFTKGKK